MHVEMDITGSKLSYTAGDHVAIFPQNNLQLVKRIGELLETDLDTVITLTNMDGRCNRDRLRGNVYYLIFSPFLEHASKKHPFPCPTTYFTALSHYVDITSSPRTNVLRELADYASDPAHKDFLLKITSATEEGKVCVSCILIQCV